MNVVNTNKNYRIDEKNIKNPTKTFGKITAFSLSIALAFTLGGGIKETEIKGNVVNETNYTAYNEYYIESLENINMDEFDSKFLEIYKNGILNINGKEYEITNLHLGITEDNVVHLFEGGNNNYDVLLEEEYENDCSNLCQFRNSTVFLNLYKNGVITSNYTEVNKDVFINEVKTWDGKSHEETPALKARSEANAKYEKRFGR